MYREKQRQLKDRVAQKFVPQNNFRLLLLIVRNNLESMTTV